MFTQSQTVKHRSHLKASMVDANNGLWDAVHIRSRHAELKRSIGA